MARPIPISREALFEHHELFFSTTNKRGIIEYGNPVFVRVSGYPKENLLKAPHSLIRHPDMPRCVFKLFWDTLQSDRPIGAYVKNMSQDGSYYWVYAVALPTSAGYLSLRLKPSSELFSKIPELYTRTLQDEGENGMEQALDRLLGTIQSLGFADYESFMTYALVEELRSRDSVIGNRSEIRIDPKNGFFRQGASLSKRARIEYRSVFDSLTKLLENGKSLRSCAEAVLNQFSDLNFLSLNMAIGAAKVGDGGKALAEVSNGFRFVAEDIQVQVQDFDQKLSRVISGIMGSQFQIGSSRLQIEVIQAFILEAANASKFEDDSDFDAFLKNYRLLLELCKSSTDQVSSSMNELVKTLNELLCVSEDLLVILNGLEVIRLTGKVEAARLGEHHREAIGTHIQQMTEFVEKISEQLKSVRRLGKDCSEELDLCLRRLSRTSSQVGEMSRLPTSQTAAD